MNNNNSIMGFHNESDIVNLTPFKICLCIIINDNALQNINSSNNIPSTNKNFMKAMMQIDNLVSDNSSPLPQSTMAFIKYQIISTLLFDDNTYQCEISKPYFLSRLSKVILSLSLPKSPLSNESKQEILTEMTDIVNDFLSNIKTIDDIFTHFKGPLSEITRIDELTPFPIFYKGSHLYNFLRKCLHSYNKLTFDELSKLFEDLKKYHSNEMIKIAFSQMENDLLFEKCFENKTMIDDIKDYVINFPQRSFFGQDSSSQDHKPSSTSTSTSASNINDQLYNLHKYFDYNLKRISNEESLTNPTIPCAANESKIHYSLLSLVDFYFEQKYFDKANQILFECIKLSQSNCDHEALLKCYLWLTKIFVYDGNYTLASQCLSTCLIKSFQNNFHLMHLLSSVELANLNYIFNGNIGEAPSSSSSSSSSIASMPMGGAMSVDEKILCHSKNYIQLYKNILEFFILNEDGCGNGDLDKMLHYALCHLILSLLEKGEHSLTMNYLKNITIRVLYDKFFTGTSTGTKDGDGDGNDKQFDKEILWSFGLFAIALEDYCPMFSFELLQEVIDKSSLIKPMNSMNIEGILQMFIRKYCIEYQGNINSLFNKQKNKGISSMGLFYEFQMKYYDLVASSEQAALTNHSSLDLEGELIEFITQCEKYHFLQYNRKGRSLLSKLYLHKGKITEAMIINKKLYEEGGNRYEKMTTMISLAYCYFYTNYLEKCKECLSKVEDCIENIGCLRDKYNFYYLKVYYMKSLGITEGKEDIIMKCLINALLLNNKAKIDKVVHLIESNNDGLCSSTNIEMLHNLQKNLLPSNRKLFTLIRRFPIKLSETFDVIMLINKNNTSFIEQWLNKYI